MQKETANNINKYSNCGELGCPLYKLRFGEINFSIL